MRPSLRCSPIALAVAYALAACTTIRPVEVGESPVAIETFSHELLDRVLQAHVDDRGRVDYAGLVEDSGDLDAYYVLLSRFSPDSHPDLFPTRNDRLAYWINGYNAATLKAVLAHYPITGIAEVRAPTLLFFMPEKSGFFLLIRVIFGGDATSLYCLENILIRPRFEEPRIHFALNCASRGCPRLPDRAFTAAGLDAELDRETRRFAADEGNVRIDTTGRRVYLSSLFDWYRDDYLEWLRERRPRGDLGILDYVALYLPPQKAALIADAGAFAVEYVSYDWGLNDRARAD